MLTHDNPLLSQLKNTPDKDHSDRQITVSDAVRAYVTKSLSENTRRAYRADLEHFVSWGGSIPCSAAMLAEYLASQAKNLSSATLVRRIASISKAHTVLFAANPAQTPIVKSTLRGIRRSKSTKQQQAKPLLREDLFAILSVMGDDIKAKRDKALLLIGFAGAFRRSELVALNVEDITSVQQGLVIAIARSKTDQDGQGRQIGIPFGRTRWCPVTALKTWLETAGTENGPIFRPISKHAHLVDSRLDSGSVSSVLKKRLLQAGYDPMPYSAHSLRAGLATSAAAAGVSSWKIRQQTGHASDATLSRYIRDGQLFENNAAGIL